MKEETDADVEVGRLLVIAESEPQEVDYIYGSTHYLKLFSECTLKPGSVPRLPYEPDPNEVAVEWIPIESLSQEPVIPNIANVLTKAINTGETMYFEDNGHAARKLNPK
ncbi:MAG TPA: hypothetical protein EYQ61_04405 [Dehalococcoidia bacterium]|nr:hypothetical protein [Dehalococcoidia bacterium]HIK89020.1 hypothetical protein [Dehalococcoidia bacterium]